MTKLGYVVNFTISSTSYPIGVYSAMGKGKIGPALPTSAREKIGYQKQVTITPSLRHLLMSRGSFGSAEGTGMRRMLPSSSRRLTSAVSGASSLLPGTISRRWIAAYSSSSDATLVVIFCVCKGVTSGSILRGQLLGGS